MFDDTQVGFVGGGNMGSALIKGLLTAKLIKPENLMVYDADNDRVIELQNTYGIGGAQNNGELALASGIIFLAVKPQVIPQVLVDLNPHLGHQPLIISIAAGISIQTLAEGLPDGLSIIRVMPNTPALVQQGASALARGPHVTDSQMTQALELFASVGLATEVEEKMLDTVTGLSGSGPAYALLFIESLIDGGVLMGLPRPIARGLAVQTVLGTAKMLQETGEHPMAMKDMITSPGGTTIRGLQILEQAGVRGAVMGAVEAASLRSEQLGKGSS